MRKRKQTYPQARTATSQRSVNRDATVPRSTVVSIDLAARTGRGDLAIGDRVRINGSGLYAGETAVVESVGGSAIPSVLVRTEAGATRRVRTIDVEKLPARPAAPAEQGQD